MKTVSLGYLFIYIFLQRVEGRPQITKIFPLKELAAFHEQTNQVKPLEKLLGKLRATYDFVFRKPEDTSNVDKILSRNSPDPDVETLKLIWANVVPVILENGSTTMEVPLDRSLDKAPEPENTLLEDEKKVVTVEEPNNEKMSKHDWLDGIEAPKPLGGLELQDDDDDSQIETVTTQSTLQFPADLGRHLLDWLGSLLGLTYGAYAKLAQSIKTA